MNKKALLILADGFEEIEALTPADILRRADISVTTAAVNQLKVTGAHKIIVIADKILDKNDTQYDICILHGGTPGVANLAASPLVKSIVTTMYRDGKYIAAICAAPARVLAPLGILDGKKATCFPGCETNFSPSTTYLEQDVVIDGNIITSRGAGTSIAFALAIVEQLRGKEIADKISKAIVSS
jgi:protein deglycase